MLIISVKKYIREYCKQTNALGAEYISEYAMTSQVRLMGYANLKPLMADFYKVHENDLAIRLDI